MFDWLLGFGCVEDLEINGRFDRHYSCLFRVHAFIDPPVGCMCQGHQSNCYTATHFVLPELYEATPVTQFTLVCCVFRVGLSPTAFFIKLYTFRMVFYICSLFIAELDFECVTGISELT